MQIKQLGSAIVVEHVRAMPRKVYCFAFLCLTVLCTVSILVLEARDSRFVNRQHPATVVATPAAATAADESSWFQQQWSKFVRGRHQSFSRRLLRDRTAAAATEPRRVVSNDALRMVLEEDYSNMTMFWPAEEDGTTTMTRCEYEIHSPNEPPVDSNGRVCSPTHFDSASGCCMSRSRNVCLGCSLTQACCFYFSSCVSCCMGTNEESWDSCRYACRTSARTLTYAFDITKKKEMGKPPFDDASSLVYCFRGPRRASRPESGKTTETMLNRLLEINTTREKNAGVVKEQATKHATDDDDDWLEF